VHWTADLLVRNYFAESPRYLRGARVALGRKLINLVRGFPARARRDSSSQTGGLRWAAMS
jgi:hypothetical protein